MTNKRLKSPYRPLHRRQTVMSIDKNGFVYVRGLKICQYRAESKMLEFVDRRRTNSQEQRIIEVSVSDFAGEFERLIDKLNYP